MKDLFSNQAAAYAAFRPTYPQDLYEFLLSHVQKRESAWDCATGNGQVARDLAPYFHRVEASDISSNQIDNASHSLNIIYTVCPAENTQFKSSSFDLITVAQAIHWFNIPEFYNEVRRVLKPDAMLAVWGYGLFRIDPMIDRLIDDFYTNIVGGYWDSERKLIDNKYATISFPFREILCPPFMISVEWTLSQLQGYLSTWSAVQKFIKMNKYDPVEEVVKRITPLFGTKKIVNFPLFIRAGLMN